ncbi:hypothetical protein [Idiomarina ramblicola]|uniref:DUF2306 domain-containing protein n=1 Tax=Idiomarina ramblicola TaxID=263724 RepID=A0A432YT78_9GAMM|nr:hypothetical protein [Idiomarina ramblicola]RUO64739.1 hypothetical protein CWI78_12630 [Idiomarina ramblicola]
MLTLHSFLLYLHIVFGAIAMALFWVPVATKKGSLNHRRFGKAYVWTMNTVAVSAIIMSIMVLIAPAYFKADIIENSQRPEAVSEGIRFFWTLLLFLSLFTFVSVRNATVVLRSKRSRANLRKFSYLSMPMGLVGMSLVLLWQYLSAPAVQFVSPWLHIIFSILGLVSAYQMLHFALAKSVKKNGWLIEHLSSMCSSGIAVYTAFFAFGARHILAYLGQWQLLFWVVPGVVGTVLIFLWSQKYDQGELS